MKLTPLQADTLRRIGAGAVYNLNCGYAAWRVQGATGSVVGRLVSRGLASWDRPVGDRQNCTITDVGRAALEQGGQP
ncbi:MAG TPA: hypothetical protein VJP88_00500 [Caulobacteraceae bacterium]|nr:hypothetical protein [Caulobacteraceae bacterium]